MAPTVIIVPVPEAEPAVDLLRRANTADGAEAMPAHVTLIYPFTDDSQLVAGRIAEVRAVLEKFSAFEFVLSDVRRFDNLPNESYVWLAPTPSSPFIKMVEELASTFPEYPPYGGAFATVIPVKPVLRPKRFRLRSRSGRRRRIRRAPRSRLDCTRSAR